MLIGPSCSSYMNKLSKSADKWQPIWKEKLIHSMAWQFCYRFCGKRNLNRTVAVALWRYLISRTYKTKVYLGIEGPEMMPATSGHAYTACSLITDTSWPQDSKLRSAWSMFIAKNQTQAMKALINSNANYVHNCTLTL